MSPVAPVQIYGRPPEQRRPWLKSVIPISTCFKFSESMSSIGVSQSWVPCSMMIETNR